MITAIGLTFGPSDLRAAAPLTAEETAYLGQFWGGKMDRKGFKTVQKFNAKIERALKKAQEKMSAQPLSAKCHGLFERVGLSAADVLRMSTQVVFLRGKDNHRPLFQLEDERGYHHWAHAQLNVWGLSDDASLDTIFKKRPGTQAFTPPGRFILIQEDSFIVPELLVHEMLHKFHLVYDEDLQKRLRIPINRLSSKNISVEIKRLCF
jgi:hypothetical protein